MSNEITAFNAIKKTASEALEIAKATKVKDADSAAIAKDKRDELKTIGDRVEAIRKDLVKPIDEARDVVQAKAKEIAALINTGRSTIEKEIMAWQAEERRKAEAAAEAERKKAEAALKREMKKETVSEEKVAVIETRIEKASAPVVMSRSAAPLKTRTVWGFTVVDASLVPRDFLMVDTVKLGAAIRRADNPLRECAGVKITSEKVPG